MIIDAKELVRQQEEINKNCIDFADWIAKNHLGKFDGKWSSIYINKEYTTNELLDLHQMEKYKKSIKK